MYAAFKVRFSLVGRLVGYQCCTFILSLYDLEFYDLIGLSLRPGAAILRSPESGTLVLVQPETQPLKMKLFVTRWSTTFVTPEPLICS